MPIEFACDCGKQFKVADEYAGKRSKCTACGKPVIVPTPPPPEPAASVEESAEDAALRALTEGDDPEPAPRTTGGYSGGYAGAAPSRPAVPPPPREDAGSHAARALANTPTTAKASKPKAKKSTRSSYESSYDAPPHRGWSPNWLKVGGGVVSILIGLALIGIRLMSDRFSIWGAALVVIGIFGIINGLLSRDGDA